MEADESVTRVDSSVSLMHHDPCDLGSGSPQWNAPLYLHENSADLESNSTRGTWVQIVNFPEDQYFSFN